MIRAFLGLAPHRVLNGNRPKPSQPTEAVCYQYPTGSESVGCHQRELLGLLG
jgi:hypothetical protein